MDDLEKLKIKTLYGSLEVWAVHDPEERKHEQLAIFLTIEEHSARGQNENDATYVLDKSDAQKVIAYLTKAVEWVP